MVAASEAGSFRRAAHTLGIDVATLSRRMAKLEDELGVLLFERGRAGVRLTGAGASALAHALKALAEISHLREAAEQSGRSEVGCLRIGTHLSTIGPDLRRLIAEWRARHPEVDFELHELDDRALFVELRERELSVIFTFDQIAREGLTFEPLWTEPLLLALPAAHPLAQVPRIGWEEVRSVPLLVRAWSGSNRYRELQSEQVGPGAVFRMQAVTSANLLNLVSIGEGAAIMLPYHREMAPPGVIFREIDEPTATMTVVLAWDSSLEDPVAGRFVTLAREYARRPKPGSSGAA